MDEQQKLPKRKATRLKEFNYASEGAYFITICTQGKKSTLSTITTVGEGSPLPQLSHYGQITDRWIRALPTQYPGLRVESYVIMPNHIHLLLSLPEPPERKEPSPTIVAAVAWLKYQATKEINRLSGTTEKKVFQRSFYDHIVRNTNDYNEILKYIYENPLRWQNDKLYAKE